MWLVKHIVLDEFSVFFCRFYGIVLGQSSFYTLKLKLHQMHQQILNLREIPSFYSRS
jgi:hypothetical protein